MHSRDRILVTVSHPAFAGPWSKAGGGEYDREVSKHRPSAGAPQQAAAGRGTVGDLTLTRLFEPGRDRALARRIARGEDFGPITITLQDLDANDAPIPGAKTTYAGCVVKGCTTPEADADADGDAAAELVVVFTVGSVA